MSVATFFSDGSSVIKKLKELADLSDPILNLADALRVLANIQSTGITTGVSAGASVRRRDLFGPTPSPGVKGISPKHPNLRGVNSNALMQVQLGHKSLSSENAGIKIAQTERRLAVQRERNPNSEFVKDEQRMLLALQNIEKVLINIENANNSGNETRQKAFQHALEDHVRPSGMTLYFGAGSDYD